MREYGVHEIGFNQLGGFADGIALDQFSHFCTHHMRAQQFAGFGVKHGFDEALCLTQSNCLSIAQEWEIADLDVIASLFGFCFGQANACNLRMTISAARNVLRVHRMRMTTRNGFCGYYALMARLMRQPWRRGNVTNRPKAGHVGAAVGIGFQEPTVHLYAERLQADIFGVWHDADRDDAMGEFRRDYLAVLALNRCRHA